MAVLQLISLLCIVGVFAYGKDDLYDEPKCYSRFDYDHKVLTKLVTLETALARMQDTTKVETATRGSVAAGCCPNGWTRFMDSCYYFTSDAELSFVDAEHYCEQHDSHLVHINDATENAFVKDHLKRLVADNYWMGLTDDMIEGIFQWIDTDTIADFTDFYPGEPNGEDTEDCVLFYSNYKYQWIDGGCSADNEAVCEIEMDDGLDVSVG